MSTAANAQGMRLIGHSDLGGAGLNGDVTVVGTTAIVAAGLMPAAGAEEERGWNQSWHREATNLHEGS